MISFHPTLTPTQFLKNLFTSVRSSEAQEYLDKLFPEQNAYLTDSGRSAFALIIETLNLEGKTMLLPAYVCDSLLPVLIQYKIKPLFIDVDQQTYQPPLSVYTDEILHKTDAVLLVATYGRKPDAEIVERIKKHNVTIIEDYASRSPLFNDSVQGDARLYSLPKTLPVPDGGIAIIPEGNWNTTPKPHRLSLGFVKDILKLLPLVAPFIAYIRNQKDRPQTKPTWHGVRQASKFTMTVLTNYAQKAYTPLETTTFSYCLPFRLNDPKRGIEALRKNSLSAERIWHQPIVQNPDVQRTFKIESEAFPVTKKIASEIVCAPLWHISDKQSLKQYQDNLQKILADLLCEERVESERNKSDQVTNS